MDGGVNHVLIQGHWVEERPSQLRLQARGPKVVMDPPEAPGMWVVAGAVIAVGLIGNRLGHRNFWVRIKYPMHAFSVKLNFRVIPQTQSSPYTTLSFTTLHKVRVRSRKERLPAFFYWRHPLTRSESARNR